MRFRELFEQDYTVNKGDTLWALAKKHGVSVNDIAKASGIADPNKLKIGQKLVIPTANATAPVPMPRPRPTSAAAIAAPSAAKPMSQNPANVTGAPVPLPAAKPMSQNPANVTGAPIAVDPVAAAKAKAAAAGQQAAALQTQIDANAAKMAANKQQRDMAQFKKADAASMAAMPPPAKPMSQNPVNANGINLSVPSDNPNAMTSQDLRNQDAEYQDRLAQADAEEAERNAALGNYVQDPNATNLPMDSPLNGFDLGQYGRNKQAVDKVINDKPFDLGQYGRDKIASGENPGAPAGTPKIDMYNQTDKKDLPNTVKLDPAAATKVTDPKGSLKDFDIGAWLKNQDLKKASDSIN